MPTSRTGIVVRTSWTAYLIKAYGVVLGLFALRLLINSGVASMPLLVCACFLISVPVTLASARILVYTKRLKATHIVAESLLGRLSSKKALGLVGCVAIGSAGAVTLVFALPLWTAVQWAIALLTIPIFWPVSLLADSIAGRTYHQPRLEIAAVPWRMWLTAAIVLLLLVLYSFFPFASPTNVDLEYLSALNNARNGLTNSPSILVSDIAHIGSQFAAVHEFVLDFAWNGRLHVAAHIVYGVQAFLIGLSIAGLLEFCRLPVRSLRTIFDPIWLSSAEEFASQEARRYPIRKQEVAVIITAYAVAIALAFGAERFYSQHGGLQAALHAAQAWLKASV